MKRDEIVVRMFEGVQTETGIDYGDPVFTGALAQVVRDNEEALPGEPLEESFVAAVSQVECGTRLVDFEVGIGGGVAHYRFELVDPRTAAKRTCYTMRCAATGESSQVIVCDGCAVAMPRVDNDLITAEPAEGDLRCDFCRGCSNCGRSHQPTVSGDGTRILTITRCDCDDIDDEDGGVYFGDASERASERRQMGIEA